MKNLLFVVLLSMITNVYASSRIERWLDGETLRFVVRDEQGKFEGLGVIELESWNDGDETSEWIARRQDGTFVTGYKGKLEKFKIKGLAKEQKRLVFRTASGEFVTWISMDERLTEGFERFDFDHDGTKETVYALRYQGKLVNWAPAKLEKWKNYAHKVLVVRDTADGKNNGKLLAVAYPEMLSNGNVVYRNPKNGQFLSKN